MARPVRPLVLAALVMSGWTLESRAAQDPPDPSSIVARVAERLMAYYERAQHLICTERSTVIPIEVRSNDPGFARTVESELRLEIDAAEGEGPPAPRVKRKVLRINGREPRAKDAKSRAGCTDPPPLASEPLAFLLPSERESYRFTAVRTDDERGRAALVVDFASTRRGDVVLIDDELGHDDCYDWSGPLPVSGRLWVDAETFAVLKLERHLAGPTDVRVPRSLEPVFAFERWLTVDRDDLWIRFTEVKFSEPEEVLLLPESIESQTIIRTGLQSTRRTQTFSGYRRFLTGGRVIK